MKKIACFVLTGMLLFGACCNAWAKDEAKGVEGVVVLHRYDKRLTDMGEKLSILDPLYLVSEDSVIISTDFAMLVTNPSNGRVVTAIAELSGETTLQTVAFIYAMRDSVLKDEMNAIMGTDYLSTAADDVKALMASSADNPIEWGDYWLFRYAADDGQFLMFEIR